jgi:colicin import membrane protein
MWQAVRENPRAVVYAVLMHLVLLVLLVFSLDWTPKITRPPGIKVPIEAELVDQRKLQALEEKKLAEQRRLEEAEKQRVAEAERKRKTEAEKKAKAEAEQKRKAEAAKKAKAEAEQKRKAEAAAKLKAEQKRKAEAKAKAEAEQKRKAEAKAKAKAEQKRKAEAEAKAKAAEEQRRREAELQKQIAAEQEDEMRRQIAAEQEEARARSALSEYIPYIQDKVQRNWLRPPGSAAGLSCLIKVRLIPGGDVVSATVVRSSGDPMFDRSVETAVLKASPLPLPTDATLFNHFREINFNFDPGR